MGLLPPSKFKILSMDVSRRIHATSLLTWSYREDDIGYQGNPEEGWSIGEDEDQENIESEADILSIRLFDGVESFELDSCDDMVKLAAFLTEKKATPQDVHRICSFCEASGEVGLRAQRCTLPPQDNSLAVCRLCSQKMSCLMVNARSA